MAFSYYNTFSLALHVIDIVCNSWFFHLMAEAHYLISQIVLLYHGSSNHFDQPVPR